MRKTLCVFATMLCFVNSTFAQNTDPSIISAASGSGKTSSLSIDWTMGEFAVETISSSSALYTQGFHQPGLVVTPMFSKAISGIGNSYNISIAPNPVVSTLNFNITASKEVEVVVSISDVHGKTHLQQKLAGKFSYTQFNFNGLPSGTYILSVRELTTSQLLKSYQIIKL